MDDDQDVHENRTLARNLQQWPNTSPLSANGQSGSQPAVQQTRRSRTTTSCDTRRLNSGTISPQWPGLDQQENRGEGELSRPSRRGEEAGEGEKLQRRRFRHPRARPPITPLWPELPTCAAHPPPGLSQKSGPPSEGTVVSAGHQRPTPRALRSHGQETKGESKARGRARGLRTPRLTVHLCSQVSG